MRGSNVASDRASDRNGLVGGLDRDERLFLGWSSALAFGLCIAAGAAMSRSDDTPLVNGTEHLMLFARPAQHQPVFPDGPVRMAVNASPPANAPAIDYTPVATIAAPREAGGASKIAARDNYVLLKVAKGRATFRGPNGTITVGTGALLPGLGRIREISRRDRKWIVQLSSARSFTR
jgi:hypothetical protein